MPLKRIDDMTDDELNETLFRNPRQLINSIRSEERAVARQEQGTREFYQTFFRRYPTLRADKGYVDTVLNQHYEKVKDMSVDEAIDMIAEMAQEAIKADERRRHRNREYGLMRGGPGLDKDEAPVPPPEGTASLGSVIRANNERRRAARLGRLERGENV